MILRTAGGTLPAAAERLLDRGLVARRVPLRGAGLGLELVYLFDAAACLPDLSLAPEALVADAATMDALGRWGRRTPDAEKLYTILGQVISSHLQGLARGL